LQQGFTVLFLSLIIHDIINEVISIWVTIIIDGELWWKQEKGSMQDRSGIKYSQVRALRVR
jgi:hypothetical protein